MRIGVGEVKSLSLELIPLSRILSEQLIYKEGRNGRTYVATGELSRRTNCHLFDRVSFVSPELRRHHAVVGLPLVGLIPRNLSLVGQDLLLQRIEKLITGLDEASGGFVRLITGRHMGILVLSFPFFFHRTGPHTRMAVASIYRLTHEIVLSCFDYLRGGVVIDQFGKPLLESPIGWFTLAVRGVGFTHVLKVIAQYLVFPCSFKGALLYTGVELFPTISKRNTPVGVFFRVYLELVSKIDVLALVLSRSDNFEVSWIDLIGGKFATQLGDRLRYGVSFSQVFNRILDFIRGNELRLFESGHFEVSSSSSSRVCFCKLIINFRENLLK